MAEILLNTNSPVRFKIFWKGQSVDADDTPLVHIYDVTDDPAITPPIPVGQLLHTVVSEKVETDIGVYQAFPPLELTTRNRTLKFVWQYDIDGESLQKEHFVYTITPYCDLAQAQFELGLGSDASDPNYKSYDELLSAEKYARTVIENYTGQRFYLYDDSHTVYGAGTDILPLPYKLYTLHELYQNDILLQDTINEITNWNYDVQISESGFGLRVNKATMLDNTVYTANGMVPPSINDTGSGGTFAKGAVYRVQGRFGWSAVPSEVEIACIELMRDYFSRDRIWRQKFLHSVQSFDWHFEYNTGAFIGTGNLYVDQLLLPFVLTQMVLI